MNRENGFLSRLILAFLATALTLAAQEAPPTVMAGTPLRVKFNSTVGTAISRPGDGVEVQLIKPVEAEGQEVLPIGTILAGRVLTVRKGDTHKKVVPVLRLTFEQARLPDGYRFPVKASLAGLGVTESVDSEGAATPTPNTKAANVETAATAAGVGAGIGAIGGGGSGAAKGAAIGGGIGVLGDLLTRNSGYWDFTLSKNRKACLRLDNDLRIAPSPSHVAQGLDIHGPSAAAQLPQTPAMPPVAPAPPKPESKGTVYVEPAPNARFYRVNTDALLRDLNKAGVRLTINPTHSDYLLRCWQDSHGFHGELADHDGLIVWVGSPRTQGGLAQGIVRYMREHALLKAEP